MIAETMKQGWEAAETPENKAFLGSLKTLAAGDVAQIIAQNRQSGRLDLESKGRAGRLAFAQSHLIGADLGGLAPAEAALELLIWDRGRFHFEPLWSEGEPPPTGCMPR
jgi:hypothetical protein